MIQACFHEDVNTVEWILANVPGSHVNREDKNWNPPLYLAAPNIDLMKILLKAGADPNSSVRQEDKVHNTWYN